MSRHLITLFSTEGKTPEQIAQEGWANYQHYEAVKAKVEAELLSNPDNSPHTEAKK